MSAGRAASAPGRSYRGLAVRVAALAKGLVLAGTFIPYSWSFLAPVPLAALFALIRRAPSGRNAFEVGFWGGVGFFGLHLLWLPVSFYHGFGPPVVLPLSLLPVLLASFWSATAGLCRLAGRYTLLALSLAWVVVEYLRSLGVFGFTWGMLGSAFLPTPIIQVADLGGVYLASLLVAGSAAAIAGLLDRHAWPAVLMANLLGTAGVYGLTRPTPPEPDLTVLLVQGAADPPDKASSRPFSLRGASTRRTCRALPTSTSCPQAARTRLARGEWAST